MSLLGWGSLLVGAATAYSGYKASENQADATAAGTAFAQEQYDHYVDLYGEAEENLSTYYQSLTPEKYEAMGLDAYDEQFKSAQSSWEQTMSQRGLSGSGIEAEGYYGMNMQAATDRASIVQQAPQQWAQDQMGFVGMGQGQGQIASQNMASNYQSLANTYGKQASAAGQGVGSLISGAMYANAYNPSSLTLSNPFASNASSTSQSNWNMYNGTLRA